MVLIAATCDFAVAFLVDSLSGSIPVCKEGFMVKLNVLFKSAVYFSNAVSSHWATKAILLVVGFWCVPLHPHAHFDLENVPTSHV
jgi:hypothetical protein